MPPVHGGIAPLARPWVDRSSGLRYPVCRVAGCAIGRGGVYPAKQDRYCPGVFWRGRGVSCGVLLGAETAREVRTRERWGGGMMG